MEEQLYKIKQLMISCAEVGAARVMKAYEPKADRLTQRQAFIFFRDRDTQFGGEFTHGEAWVRQMVREGLLHPQRTGKSQNSPLYYSKHELLSVRAACDAQEKGLLNI